MNEYIQWIRYISRGQRHIESPRGTECVGQVLNTITLTQHILPWIPPWKKKKKKEI